MQFGYISFCNSTAFNIKSEHVKKDILNNYLTRANNLKSQIYSSRFERFKNVENEYSTAYKLEPNLNILIVDDVVT